MHKLILSLSLSAIFFCGCGSNMKYEPIDQVNVSGQVTKTQAMKISEDVLKRMHFSVEKFDVEAGMIKTRPLRAAQWFEFWRKDNVGKFNRKEANRHTLRRQVTLELAKHDEAALSIHCQAKTQRLGLMETDKANSSQSSSEIYNLFSDSSDDLQTLNVDKEKMTWIELGRDKQLEAAILNKIKDNISREKR